jgi:hypothetical protein
MPIEEVQGTSIRKMFDAAACLLGDVIGMEPTVEIRTSNRGRRRWHGTENTKTLIAG